MYSEGQGVEQDRKEALKWYTLAAKQGDVCAQFSLGLMHYSGDGVPQDNEEALKCFKMAARSSAEAKFSVGVMYVKGQGVDQDKKEALKWFKMAAEQGHINGLNAYKQLSQEFQSN